MIKLKTSGSKLCQKLIMSVDDIRNFDQRLCRSDGTIYLHVSQPLPHTSQLENLRHHNL